MGVDNRSADFLGKPLAIGANTGHKNSDRQQDTLAAALVRILVKLRRTSTQLRSLVAGQITGQEIPLGEQFANQCLGIRRRKSKALAEGHKAERLC